MHYVNDINLVPKMGQIIKVQWPVSSAPINGLYLRPVCDIRGHIYNIFADNKNKISKSLRNKRKYTFQQVNVIHTGMLGN
jgi:hypothetical protein